MHHRLSTTVCLREKNPIAGILILLRMSIIAGFPSIDLIDHELYPAILLVL